jgi:hypothetical protein
MEHRHRLYILAFGGACLLGSAYGFLQGAWPFGLVEGVWSLIAFRRWWRAQARHRRHLELEAAAVAETE